MCMSRDWSETQGVIFKGLPPFSMAALNSAGTHKRVYNLMQKCFGDFFFFFVECSISIIESKRLFHFCDVYPNLWRMTKLSQDAIWLALTEVVSCKCSHGFLSFTCFSLTCAGKWSCTYFIKPSVLSKYIIGHHYRHGGRWKLFVFLGIHFILTITL